MLTDEGGAGGIAEPLGELRRATDVGEQDSPDRRRGVGVADRVRGERTEEGVDGARLDLHDRGGEEPVCLSVDVLDRLAVRSFGEAEDRRRVGIEPVGQVAHAVVVLDPHVGAVGGGDVFGAGTGHVMAVEEERHGPYLG